MAKHVHAEIIKAWADGAEIEVQLDYDRWVPIGSFPGWAVTQRYRVKPEPHKWQAVIDAWKAGKQVQWKLSGGKIWHAMLMPEQEAQFDGFEQWRIKPEPVVQLWYFDGFSHRCMSSAGRSNLKLTFEDNTLIAAEVLK